MPTALVSNNYGMTEAGSVYCLMPPGEAVRRPGSVGKPLPPAEIVSVDDAGDPVPPGEVGQVRMRITGRPREYYGDPEATARTWVDGWLVTGDLGRLDEDGYLYIVGRSKDVIIRGGNNIHPTDVEHAIASHPAVHEVAVVGVEHPVLGRGRGGVRRPPPGDRATPDELREHTLEQLARYKVPRRWNLVDALPRNATGKVVKGELRVRAGRECRSRRSPAAVVDGIVTRMPKNDVVGIGIVGAGNIASMNVAGYLEDPRCKVVAVCDPREGQAAGAAAAWGAPPAYTDLDALLADPAVDAVEILTPTNLHHDHVLAALAAGKHVSCQKPLANSVAEARAMDAAAHEAGLILRVSECFRHYPPLELAKRLIEDGAIGKPTNLRTRTVVGQTDSAFQAGLDIEGYLWRMTNASPGGHLFDDMIHKYAVALWLLDQDIVSVQAAVRRRDYYFEPLAAIFEYEDPEVLGTMEVCLRPPDVAPQRLLRGRRVLRGPGGRGVPLGDPVHRPAPRPPGRGPLRRRKGSQTTTSFPHVDDDWGAGFRRPPPTSSTPWWTGSAGDERHRGHQGPAALLRRLRGRQHPPAGGPPHHRPPGRPRGVAHVKVTRTLHHSVNVEGSLAPPSPSTATSGHGRRRPSGHPRVGGHWFAAGNAQLHLVDADAGDGAVRPAGPHVCFAVDDLDAAVAELEAGGIPYLRGAQGPVVQIWFADPAGNTVEIQQDPDLHPTGTATTGT